MADRHLSDAQQKLAQEACWQIEALVQALPDSLRDTTYRHLAQGIAVRVQQLTDAIGDLVTGAGDEAQAKGVIEGLGIHA